MNFSFLNSAVLWAIPLSFLPLVLHLLFRRPPRIVAFSDLRFLEKIYQRYRPRKKLREWLILLFRILTLLFLFLFFSRPVMHWSRGGGTEDSAALVILLDASYSMRYQESGISYWSRAAQLAQKALGSLRESDRSALVIFADDVFFFPGRLTNEHRQLSDKLKEFQPTYRNTNFLPPLQIAYQLLSNSGASNKTILILSDMAKHGWISTGNQPLDEKAIVRNWETSIKNYDPTVRILFSNLPGQRQNVAVTDARLFPDLYSGLLKVEVDLKNWSEETESNLPVFLDFSAEDSATLFHSKVKRQSESLVHLGSLEKKSVVLTAPLVEGEMVAGAVGVRSDSLPTDDAFYFAQPSPQKIKILCLEEPSGIAALSGESYYLRQALASPPSPFEIKTMPFNQIGKISLNEFRAVVLVNPGDLSGDSFQLLSRYIKSGGGSLFLTLGGRSNIGQLASVSGLLPCSLQEVRQTASLSLLPTDIEEEGFVQFKSEYDWGKIRVNKIVQPAINENGEAWILFSDGTPLLIFSRDRKVAVWTSSIDRSWNNFASKPVFAPLMQFILRKLSMNNTVELTPHLRVGESFKKKFSFWIKKESFDLFSPSAKTVSFQILQNELVSAPMEEPGLYALIQKSEGKGVINKIAVNLEQGKEESNLLSISDRELKMTLPRTTFQSLTSGENFSGELIAALRGKEFSRFFLAFAGVCLLGEMFFIYKKT